ncbi:MAG: hypothetical protein HZB56_13720 [Deltaproteobacteria bacterium]|nr:hypothetical protein [Deltaproteobacteria bacterium]
MRLSAMPLRAAALLLAAAACQRAEAPPASPERSLSGRLLLPGRGGPDQPAAGEVLVLPEATLAPFLARRAAEAEAGRAQGRAGREALAAERARLLAEQDRADARWRALGDTDLGRRLALRVRPRNREEMRAAEERFQKEKRAAHAAARTAARRAEEKERELAALEEAAGRFRSCAFLLSGLPAASASARAGPDGRFTVRLPPGRVGAVARATGPGGGETCWAVWLAPRDGPLELQLDGKNTLLSGCAACAAPAGAEPVSGPRLASPR